MSAFNPGDVVKLKSGGPDMTVERTGDFGPAGPEKGVVCTWFERAKRSTEVFSEETLKRTTDL